MKKIISIVIVAIFLILTVGMYVSSENQKKRFDSQNASNNKQLLVYRNEIRDLVNKYVEFSKERQLGADTVLPTAGMTYTLFTGVSSSATSLTLSSFTIPQSGYEITDSDLSGTFYLTIEPGNRSRQEIVSCTTVTQNSGSTSTLSGCTRGLSPIPPYTASTTLQFSHAGGSSMILSDAPQLFNEYTAKGNDETITGIWTYTSTAQPRYNATPSLTGNSLYFASVGYVDALANQGAATSTESNAGISQLATQLQMASSTDLGANDPLVLQAKYATSTTDVRGLYIPVAQNNGYLKQSWLDLSEAFTFSNLLTFSGGLTGTNATTTNLHISGITSSLLKTDSNGRVQVATAGTDYAGAKYNFSTTTDMTTDPAGTADVDTASFIIPAGVITASSTIAVKANLESDDSDTSGGTCTFELRDSANTVLSSIIYRNFTTDDNVPGAVDILVAMSNSVSSQISTARGWSIVTGTSVNQYFNTSETTSSINFAGAVSLKGTLVDDDTSISCQLLNMIIDVNP